LSEYARFAAQVAELVARVVARAGDHGRVHPCSDATQLAQAHAVDGHIKDGDGVVEER